MAVMAFAAPTSAVAEDQPDFGEGVQAIQVAWHLMKVVDAHTVAIRGPHAIFCSNEPSLKPVVTDAATGIVLDVYELRSTGPEKRCRHAKTLKTRVTLPNRIEERAFYDGLFSPPRLRPLPFMRGETLRRDRRDPDGYRIELVGE